MAEHTGYAVVAWVPEDIQSLRPSWDLDKCEEWLAQNAKYIADLMVERGWNAIETLLPPRTEETEDAE